MHTTQTSNSRSAALLQTSVPAESWQIATQTPMLRVASIYPYRPTRREFLVGAGSLLILALLGCGESGTAGETTSSGMRSFEHAAGVTDVPVNPERIVTISDQNALLPLLELGVKPVASAGLPTEGGGEGTFRRTDGFDTSGIEFVGDYMEPNLEAIANLEPDLIVGYEFQEDIYDRLSQIAPTVLIQIFDRPLDEASWTSPTSSDAWTGPESFVRSTCSG